MARKARLEFAGAIYYVLNRGSSAPPGRAGASKRKGEGRPGISSELFGTADAAQAFVNCVFEAADRMQWRIHAYCVMPERLPSRVGDAAGKSGEWRPLAAERFRQSLQSL